MNRVFKRAIDKNKVSPPYFYNSFKAFMVGGTICLIGQILIYIFKDIVGLEKDICNNLVVTIMIIAASLLTAFGYYDKLGQFAGAGSIVPVTGFANSMTSAALESKSEGLVLGIGTNTFKLAGSVITFGVVSAYVFGIIRYFIEVGL